MHELPGFRFFTNGISILIARRTSYGANKVAAVIFSTKLHQKCLWNCVEHIFFSQLNCKEKYTTQMATANRISFPLKNTFSTEQQQIVVLFVLCALMYVPEKGRNFVQYHKFPYPNYISRDVFSYFFAVLFMFMSCTLESMRYDI